MAETKYPYIKLCDCGCRQIKIVKNSRYTKFISGHNSYGRSVSDETKSKIRMSLMGHDVSSESRTKMRFMKLGLFPGDKNPAWMGDDVGYGQLHNWVKQRKPRPDFNLCQLCFNECDKLQLANLTNKYRRDISDWFYLCQSCHYLYDR